MISRTDIHVEISLCWLIFALASKCESLTWLNILTLAFLFTVLSCIILHLTFWAHPGGPAWGNYYNSWRNPKSIPGPKGIPIFGSMDLMAAGLPHHKIAAAAQAYNAKRLMAFSLGHTRALVTCNPDVAKEILNGSTFADRPANESAYNLMFNRSIGFAPYGVYWTALRKIAATHLFCPKQIKSSEQQRLEIANQLVAAVMISSSSRKINIRVRDLLKHASLNNMMCSVFGRKYDIDVVGSESVINNSESETEELKDLVDQGYDLLGQVNWSDHLSLLSDLDLQRIRFRCSRIVPRVNRFVGRIIAEHKVSGGPDHEMMNRDFVDVLLSLKGADRLSDSDMIAVLWEMIFRGTDTVAVLIEWILARLVLHPDVQSKVHAELDKVVGIRSRAVTESDLTELIYLTAVVKEVLRLHPPGPLLSWSRLSIRDSTLDGYHVPKGTTAMVNMWAIMRDPLVWPDPLNFNPDRFMGQNYSNFSDLRVAPFGSGRRSCPGKDLGMRTVNFWVATLLHEFEFESSSSTSTGEVDLSEMLRLSCEMANPLMVRVRPRRSIYMT